MIERNAMLMLVCACVTVSSVAAQPRSGGGLGRGLSIKDLQRVEQVRGDSGGLSRSLAQAPAGLGVPGDFSGVYQIPDDADTPYAGWFARASGATIAVFPRGEYTVGPDGVMVTLPANTRFFLGTIPLGGRKAGTDAGTRVKPTMERVDARVDDRWRADEPTVARRPAPDAALPPTVDTAPDLASVSVAVEKLCNDPVYRANRVRELIERASRTRVTSLE